MNARHGTLASVDQREAIDLYLEVWRGDDGPVSFLEAAMRDARTAWECNARWLATLGYLVAVEQIGHTVVRSGTGTTDRKFSRRAFMAALEDFAPELLDEDGQGVLYEMRCALAHEYGLQSERTPRVFAYTESGPPLRLPAETWDGTAADAKRLEVTTVVNLAAVADLVERLVASLREAHAEGHMELAQGVAADEVPSLLRFNITR